MLSSYINKYLPTPPTTAPTITFVLSSGDELCWVGVEVEEEEVVELPLLEEESEVVVVVVEREVVVVVLLGGIVVVVVVVVRIGVNEVVLETGGGLEEVTGGGLDEVTGGLEVAGGLSELVAGGGFSEVVGNIICESTLFTNWINIHNVNIQYIYFFIIIIYILNIYKK